MFIGHGTEDAMVPLSSYERTVDTLKELGFSVKDFNGNEQGIVSTRTYEGMGHAVDKNVIADLRKWLKSVIAPLP